MDDYHRHYRRMSLDLGSLASPSPGFSRPRHNGYSKLPDGIASSAQAFQSQFRSASLQMNSHEYAARTEGLFPVTLRKNKNTLSEDFEYDRPESQLSFGAHNSATGAIPTSRNQTRVPSTATVIYSPATSSRNFHYQENQRSTSRNARHSYIQVDSTATERPSGTPKPAKHENPPLSPFSPLAELLSQQPRSRPSSLTFHSSTDYSLSPLSTQGLLSGERTEDEVGIDIEAWKQEGRSQQSYKYPHGTAFEQDFDARPQLGYHPHSQPASYSQNNKSRTRSSPEPTLLPRPAPHAATFTQFNKKAAKVSTIPRSVQNRATLPVPRPVSFHGSSPLGRSSPSESADPNPPLLQYHLSSGLAMPPVSPSPTPSNRRSHRYSSMSAQSAISILSTISSRSVEWSEHEESRTHAGDRQDEEEELILAEDPAYEPGVRSNRPSLNLPSFSTDAGARELVNDTYVDHTRKDAAPSSESYNFVTNAYGHPPAQEREMSFITSKQGTAFPAPLHAPPAPLIQNVSAAVVNLENKATSFSNSPPQFNPVSLPPSRTAPAGDNHAEESSSSPASTIVPNNPSTATSGKATFSPARLFPFLPSRQNLSSRFATLSKSFPRLKQGAETSAAQQANIPHVGNSRETKEENSLGLTVINSAREDEKTHATLLLKAGVKERLKHRLWAYSRANANNDTDTDLSRSPTLLSATLPFSFGRASPFSIRRSVDFASQNGVKREPDGAGTGGRLVLSSLSKRKGNDVTNNPKVDAVLGINTELWEPSWPTRTTSIERGIQSNHDPKHTPDRKTPLFQEDAKSNKDARDYSRQEHTYEESKYPDTPAPKMLNASAAMARLRLSLNGHRSNSRNQRRLRRLSVAEEQAQVEEPPLPPVSNLTLFSLSSFTLSRTDTLSSHPNREDEQRGSRGSSATVSVSSNAQGDGGNCHPGGSVSPAEIEATPSRSTALKPHDNDISRVVHPPVDQVCSQNAVTNRENHNEESQTKKSGSLLPSVTRRYTRLTSQEQSYPSSVQSMAGSLSVISDSEDVCAQNTKSGLSANPDEGYYFCGSTSNLHDEKFRCREFDLNARNQNWTGEVYSRDIKNNSTPRPAPPSSFSTWSFPFRSTKKRNALSIDTFAGAGDNNAPVPASQRKNIASLFRTRKWISSSAEDWAKEEQVVKHDGGNQELFKNHKVVLPSSTPVNHHYRDSWLREERSRGQVEDTVERQSLLSDDLHPDHSDSDSIIINRNYSNADSSCYHPAGNHGEHCPPFVNYESGESSKPRRLVNQAVDQEETVTKLATGKAVNPADPHRQHTRIPSFPVWYSTPNSTSSKKKGKEPLSPFSAMAVENKYSGYLEQNGKDLLDVHLQKNRSQRPEMVEAKRRRGIAVDAAISNSEISCYPQNSEEHRNSFSLLDSDQSPSVPKNTSKSFQVKAKSSSPAVRTLELTSSAFTTSFEYGPETVLGGGFGALEKENYITPSAINFQQSALPVRTSSLPQQYREEYQRLHQASVADADCSPHSRSSSATTSYSSALSTFPLPYKSPIAEVSSEHGYISDQTHQCDLETTPTPVQKSAGPYALRESTTTPVLSSKIPTGTSNAETPLTAFPSRRIFSRAGSATPVYNIRLTPTVATEGVGVQESRSESRAGSRLGSRPASALTTRTEQLPGTASKVSGSPFWGLSVPRVRGRFKSVASVGHSGASILSSLTTPETPSSAKSLFESSAPTPASFTPTPTPTPTSAPSSVLGTRSRRWASIAGLFPSFVPRTVSSTLVTRRSSVKSVNSNRGGRTSQTKVRNLDLNLRVSLNWQVGKSRHDSDPDGNAMFDHAVDGNRGGDGNITGTAGTTQVEEPSIDSQVAPSAVSALLEVPPETLEASPSNPFLKAFRARSFHSVETHLDLDVFARVHGISLLYLPRHLTPVRQGLAVPVGIAATGAEIVRSVHKSRRIAKLNGTTPGIPGLFRVSGRGSVVSKMSEYFGVGSTFLAPDVSCDSNGGDPLSGQDVFDPVEITIRSSLLPKEWEADKYTVLDVGQVFKRVIAAIKGGILGDAGIFASLEKNISGEDQQLNEERVARIILGIGSPFRRALIVGVFGILRMVAERRRSECSHGLGGGDQESGIKGCIKKTGPLGHAHSCFEVPDASPQSGEQMSPHALGLVFAPLLLGDETDRIEVRQKDYSAGQENLMMESNDLSAVTKTCPTFSFAHTSDPQTIATASKQVHSAHKLFQRSQIFSRKDHSEEADPNTETKPSAASIPRHTNELDDGHSTNLVPPVPPIPFIYRQNSETELSSAVPFSPESTSVLKTDALTTPTTTGRSRIIQKLRLSRSRTRRGAHSVRSPTSKTVRGLKNHRSPNQPLPAGTLKSAKSFRSLSSLHSLHSFQSLRSVRSVRGRDRSGHEQDAFRWKEAAGEELNRMMRCARMVERLVIQWDGIVREMERLGHENAATEDGGSTRPSVSRTKSGETAIRCATPSNIEADIPPVPPIAKIHQRVNQLRHADDDDLLFRPASGSSSYGNDERLRARTQGPSEANSVHRQATQRRVSPISPNFRAYGEVEEWLSLGGGGGGDVGAYGRATRGIGGLDGSDESMVGVGSDSRLLGARVAGGLKRSMSRLFFGWGPRDQHVGIDVGDTSVQPPRPEIMHVGATPENDSADQVAATSDSVQNPMGYGTLRLGGDNSTRSPKRSLGVTFSTGVPCSPSRTITDNTEGPQTPLFRPNISCIVAAAASTFSALNSQTCFNGTTPRCFPVLPTPSRPQAPPPPVFCAESRPSSSDPASSQQHSEFGNGGDRSLPASPSRTRTVTALEANGESSSPKLSGRGTPLSRRRSVVGNRSGIDHCSRTRGLSRDSGWRGIHGNEERLPAIAQVEGVDDGRMSSLGTPSGRSSPLKYSSCFPLGMAGTNGSALSMCMRRRSERDHEEADHPEGGDTSSVPDLYEGEKSTGAGVAVTVRYDTGTCTQRSQCASIFDSSSGDDDEDKTPTQSRRVSDESLSSSTSSSSSSFSCSSYGQFLASTPTPTSTASVTPVRSSQSSVASRLPSASFLSGQARPPVGGDHRGRRFDLFSYATDSPREWHRRQREEAQSGARSSLSWTKDTFLLPPSGRASRLSACAGGSTVTEAVLESVDGSSVQESGAMSFLVPNGKDELGTVRVGKNGDQEGDQGVRVAQSPLIGTTTFMSSSTGPDGDKTPTPMPASPSFICPSCCSSSFVTSPDSELSPGHACASASFLPAPRGGNGIPSGYRRSSSVVGAGPDVSALPFLPSSAPALYQEVVRLREEVERLKRGEYGSVGRRA